MSSDLLSLAEKVVKRSKELGADEASATVSRSTQTSLARRDRKVEQASDAISRGLAFSVLVDGRYSSHSTSDLREDALDAFIREGIALTRYLEPDPDRALPDPALCGRSIDDATLDQLDPVALTRTADERAADAERLEEALLAKRPASTISCAVHISDGSGETARVTSNGFADTHREAYFMAGGEITLGDGEKRPESASYFATRYLAELPDFEFITSDVVARSLERVGSGPMESGEYVMILPNRIAPRILGLLGGPLAGSQLHEGRSCLSDRLGTKIGSDLLTIVDDPLIPRGLASRPWDGDGLRAERRAIVTEGVLNSYYISVYYGRKLGVAPTTGGRSNWVVKNGPGPVPQVPKAIVVDGFLGGNSNAVTGDFSLGIRGALVENGVRTRALSEMNVSGNLLSLLDRLVAVGDDPWPYSSVFTPTLMFDAVQFSGT